MTDKSDDLLQLESFKKILENSFEEQKLVVKGLQKILENVLNNPVDNEFRKIHLLSENVVENLMPFSGGLEFLFELGFVEDEDNLILPMTVSLKKLKYNLAQLAGFFHKKATSSLPVTKSFITTIKPKRDDYRQISEKNRVFFSKIESSFNQVLTYEDKNLQAKALRIIPVERIKSKAKEKFNEFKNGQNLKEEEELEFILLELLSWYKNEFFQWVNEPDCFTCQTKEFMNFHSSGIPTEYELTWGAGRVEVYKCTKCNQITRFPRFNHPSKLLDTHKGRCGEWANCFTLCLRAMSFEARYVLDWTDHVWSEVYSISQKRWLHIDPCESSLDKPLVYEHGWGKKLSYIIAFSFEEIVDVTWRYSSKHKEVLSRRNECDELWLVQLLVRMNNYRQKNLAVERRKELESRSVTELVEFVSPKIIKDGEDIGRQSGSLQWRLERGEIGDSVKQAGNVIKPNESEMRCLKMNIQYNTAKNVYHRGNGESTNTWTSLAYAYSNVQLKIENDWKMCYLARTEGSKESFIEWAFDFGEKLKVKEFRLKFKADCFESGEIKCSILNDKSEKTIDQIFSLNGDYNIVKNLDELSKFKLRVDMSKGNGSNAFQHTQLFRQKLDDININLFEIDFILQ